MTTFNSLLMENDDFGGVDPEFFGYAEHADYLDEDGDTLTWNPFIESYGDRAAQEVVHHIYTGFKFTLPCGTKISAKLPDVVGMVQYRCIYSEQVERTEWNEVDVARAIIRACGFNPVPSSVFFQAAAGGQ